MTTQEFSDQFDLFYNNITSNQAPGLDEYEKSVFLTTAQEEILKAYFNPRENKVLQGYDDSALRQADFSSITVVYEVEELSDTPVFNRRSNTKSITMPDDDIIAIINEEATVTRNGSSITLEGIAISYAEYTRLLRKPFSYPAKRECWRILSKNETNRADILIGPNDTLTAYYMRYIKKPCPIILEDLNSGESIDGETELTECELDPIIHKDILYRAVELAKAAYMDMNQLGILLAQSYALGLSGTEKGYTSSK